MKIVIKQDFNHVDAVLFEANLVLNAVETLSKIKEYVV